MYVYRYISIYTYIRTHIPTTIDKTLWPPTRQDVWLPVAFFVPKSCGHGRGCSANLPFGDLVFICEIIPLYSYIYIVTYI